MIWLRVVCRARLVRSYCRSCATRPLPRRQRIELCVQEVEQFGPMTRDQREAAISRWSRDKDLKDWCRVGYVVRKRLGPPAVLPDHHG